MRHILILAVALLAGCASNNPAPPTQPAAGAAEFNIPACLAELDRRGIVYDKVADWHQENGCGITGAVRIKRSAIAWNRAVLVSCPLAVTIWDFETKVVEPAAQHEFHQNVRQMSNFGTYSCRGEIGGRADRLSEHAHGRAIDISGFTLADGTSINVLHDWKGAGKKSQFLQEVAQGACQTFKGVITPNHNSYHLNHLHLDIGPYKFCGL